MPNLACENPDHEMLSRLATDDPQAFDALCQQLLREMIERAPPDQQRKLAWVQCKIDIIRRRAGNPLSATVNIYQLMWRSFLRLRHELTTIRSPTGVATGRPAQIIDFRSRKRIVTG